LELSGAGCFLWAGRIEEACS